MTLGGAPRPLRPRPGSGALGGPLVHLDVSGSTNDRARDLARDGAPDGTVVVAEEQTAGRGRQGRRWLAPRGRGLTLSVVVRPLTGVLDLLPLATALAVSEACEEAAAVRCRIKWPNDVWIGERKLAGILIEGRPQEGWAVIGIGLNVATTREELDPELRDTATSLEIETGAAPSRDRVLDALIDRLADWLARPRAGDRGAILTAYRERDALRGRRIVWTAPGERRLSGEAQGIDESGNLVVFTDDGERIALESGEVHLVATGAGPKG